MRGVRLAIVVLGALLIAGCTPLDQGAITLDEETNRPALVTAFCEGEGLTAVRLTAAIVDDNFYSEGPVLWRIEASQSQPLRHVIVGETPPAFRETVAFEPTADVPNELVLVGESEGGTAAEHGGLFERDQLEVGILVQDGEQISQGSLDRAARLNCSGSLFGSLGLPTWLGWALLAALAAGAAVALAVLRARARR